MRAAIATVVCALVVASASCTGGGDRSAGSTTVASTLGPVTTFPADQIVWQARTVGGRVVPVAEAAEVPTITIYGDGRAYLATPGADRRFDQPVPMQIGRVDTAELSAFVARAEASGLFSDEVDLGRPAVDDMSTTRLRLQGTDGVRRVDAYALGGRFDAELTDAQALRREELRLLLAAAEQLVEVPEPWTPTRVRVMRLPDGAPFTESPEADPDEPPPPWPGPPLDAFMTPTDGAGPTDACGELEGEAAVTVFDAALENPTPLWQVDGAQRTIVMSVVLPGETACGDR